MSDLISRADAIEAVKETKPIVRSTERNWGKMIAEQHSKELVKALKALPSAEAEWIPVSERLPKEGQGVLVTVDDNEFGIKVGSCIYSGGIFHSKLYQLSVLAWMPLPKPYKGDDDK